MTWYDVQCVRCKAKVVVDAPLKECPRCGSTDKPEPLPAMAMAHSLRDRYLKKKEQALREGPQILNGREYAGLLVVQCGREGALELWRAMPRGLRRRWRGAGPLLEKLRSLEIEVTEGASE